MGLWLCSFGFCVLVVYCKDRVRNSRCHSPFSIQSQLSGGFFGVHVNSMFPRQTYKSIFFPQINTFLNYKFSISRQLIINHFPSVCADVFEWSMATTTATVHYLLQVSSAMNLISGRDAGHIRPNRRKVSKNLYFYFIRFRWTGS